MKKTLVLLLLCFATQFAFGQEKESFTVSPEYARILENCCPNNKKGIEKEFFSNLKSSRDRTLENIFKKRRLRIHATNTLHHKEEWSLRARRHLDGYFVGIGYETNRDPIKLLFEPIVESFFNPAPN